MNTKQPDYIKIGDRVFARTNALFCETLFKPINGRTAHGMFKRTKQGVLFSKGNGEVFAFLVVDAVMGEGYFVTASRTDGISSNVPSAKVRYMQGLCDLDKAELGMSGLGYREEQNIAKGIVAMFEN